MSTGLQDIIAKVKNSNTTNNAPPSSSSITSESSGATTNNQQSSSSPSKTGLTDTGSRVTYKTDQYGNISIESGTTRTTEQIITGKSSTASGVKEYIPNSQLGLQSNDLTGYEVNTQEGGFTKLPEEAIQQNKSGFKVIPSSKTEPSAIIKNLQNSTLDRYKYNDDTIKSQAVDINAGTVTEAKKPGILQKTGVTKLASDFMEGFTVGGYTPNTADAQRFTTGERLKAGLINPVAFTGGFIGGLYTLGKGEKVASGVSTANKAITNTLGQAFNKIPYAAQITEKVVPAGTRAFFNTNRLGIGIKAGATMAAEIKTINLLGKGADNILASKEIRDIRKTPGYKEDVTKAFSELGKAQEGTLWNLGYSINPIISRNQQEFMDVFVQQGKAKGLGGKELENYVAAGKRELATASITEATTLLAISSTTERAGRKMFDVAFNKIGSIAKKDIAATSVKAGIPILSSLGFMEGFSQQVAQQEARFDERKLLDTKATRSNNIAGFEFKTNRLQEAAGMGVLGGVSAATIGSAIIGFSFNKKGVSKAIEWSANILDPFEKPGDIVANRIDNVAEFLGYKVAKPKVVVLNEPTAIFSGNLAPTSTQSSGKRAKVSLPSILPINSYTTSYSPNGYVGVPIPTVIPTETPTDNDTPIFIPTETPTDTNTIIPTTTNTNTFTNTNTNTFTDTFSQSITFNTPVVTPQVRLPPPLPFMFPSGSGGGGSGRIGKKSKFINELEVGKQLLGELTGGNLNIGKIYKNVKPRGKRK